MCVCVCVGGKYGGRGGGEEEARGRFSWALLPDSSYDGLFWGGAEHKLGLAAHIATMGMKSVLGQD